MLPLENKREGKLKRPFFIVLALISCVLISGCTQLVKREPYKLDTVRLSVNDARRQLLDACIPFFGKAGEKYINKIKGDLKGVKTTSKGDIVFIGAPYSSSFQLFADSTAYHFLVVSIGENPKIIVEKYHYSNGRVDTNAYLKNIRIICGACDGEPKVTNDSWSVKLETNGNGEAYKSERRFLYSWNSTKDNELARLVTILKTLNPHIVVN